MGGTRLGLCLKVSALRRSLSLLLGVGPVWLGRWECPAKEMAQPRRWPSLTLRGNHPLPETSGQPATGSGGKTSF